VSPTRRTGPEARPTISSLPGAPIPPQHATDDGAAGKVHHLYRWALASKRRSLLIELQADWVALVTRRAA